MALSGYGSRGWVLVNGQRVYRSIGDAGEDILVRGARDIGAKLSRSHVSMEGEQISTKPRDMGGGHGSPRNDILGASVHPSSPPEKPTRTSEYDLPNE